MLAEVFDAISGKWRGLRGSPDGSAHTIDGVFGVPLYSERPTIDDTPAKVLRIDMGDSKLSHVRYTVNPGDSLVAAERLGGSFEDTELVIPEWADPIIVPTDGTDGEITEVYAIVVGDGTGTNAAGIITHADADIVNLNGGGSVGKPVMPNVTAAQLLAGDYIIRWRFANAKKVRDALIGLTNAVVGDTEAYVVLGGRSYA